MNMGNTMTTLGEAVWPVNKRQTSLLRNIILGDWEYHQLINLREALVVMRFPMFAMFG